MRHLSKVGMTALLIALAVAVAVAAGCGSTATSSDTSSAAPSADTSKAYKIGITQIVTHPALDAAVTGFKEAPRREGRATSPMTSRTLRVTWRPPPPSRRSSRARIST